MRLPQQPAPRGRSWSVALFTLLLLGGALAGCDGCAEEPSEAAGVSEEATFNLGEPITDSTYALVVASDYGADTLTAAEFRQQFDRFVQQFPPLAADVQQSQELRRMIAESFVLQHVLKGEAERSGAEVDTALAGEQFRQIRGQFPTAEAFEEVLAAQGVTEEELRADIEERVRQQAVQDEILAGAAGPSEEELEAFRQEQAEQVRAQHILFMVGPGATEEEQAEVEARAEAVLDSVEGGADFAEMARRHSEDGSAATGGDLNFFSRGDMVPPFEEAAFALQDSGDVTSELVETQFGYHIIRLTGRRTGEAMDTSRARQLMMRERQQEAMEAGFVRLREDAGVVVHVNDAIVEADLNEVE